MRQRATPHGDDHYREDGDGQDGDGRDLADSLLAMISVMRRQLDSLERKLRAQYDLPVDPPRSSD